MPGLKGGLAGLYVHRIILILEEIKMNKIFMGLLAVAALALIVSQAQAIRTMRAMLLPMPTMAAL